ncbi:hypothetical protein ABFT23_04925 [Nocardioides sp. C4-1]|uniref:hypothetical protein n=1 Tax=Nocardioides sp. C4-1 TaxID=3151851 RepID=UPI0032639360
MLTSGSDERVVWNDTLRGLRIVSARTDGTDRRVIYERTSQDAYNLVLSPDESMVAFAPFDRRGPATRLMVVPTTGGQARNLFPRRSGAIGLGPIGWSRDGRRLIFQSFVEEPAKPQVEARLFSIRVSDRHLRRGRPVNGRALGVASGDVAVTRRGIVTKDGNTIRLFPTLGPGSKSRVIARNAYDMRTSGDGRWIFYTRAVGRHQSLQQVRATGGTSTTVVRWRLDGLDKPYAFAPDTTGARLLVVGEERTAQPVTRYTRVLETSTGDSADLPLRVRGIIAAW